MERELISTLAKAKQQMIDISARCAAVEGNWERAQSLLAWAKAVDDMLRSLNSSDPGPVALSNPTSARGFIPYHYVQGDKLVKVGASRNGSTYEHRVTRRNFDLVLNQLIQLVTAKESFETTELIDRCDIPRHEPLIVLAVLKGRGLLDNFRRGRWRFVARQEFASRASTVWREMPDQPQH